MAAYDNKQIRALILDLSSASHDKFGNAYETLVKIGSDAIPDLLDAFLSPEQWLTKIETFKNAESTFIDREAVTFRRWIAKVLGDIGDPAAIDGLTSLIAYPDNDLLGQNLRHAVIHALGQLHAANAIPQLKQNLNNPSHWTRIEAAHALNQIPEAKSQPELVKLEVEILIPIVRTAERNWLTFAMFTLAEIDYPSVVPVLAEKLADKSLFLDTLPEHGRICDFAVKALQQNSSPQALEIVAAWQRDNPI